MGHLLIGLLVGVVSTAVFIERAASKRADGFRAAVAEYQAGVDRLIELLENMPEPPWEVG